jgi:hypothetical protein
LGIEVNDDLENVRYVGQRLDPRIYLAAFLDLVNASGLG